MNKAELESKHIAELHELAAEAGVERYRMLRREELVDQLAGTAGSDDGGSGATGPKRGRERPGDEGQAGSETGKRRRRRRGRRGGSDREERDSRRSAHDGDSERERAGEGAVQIGGPLEILAEGGGVVRDGDREALLSPAQIKRCELRSGDFVEGPAQGGRREGAKLTMTRVEKVNGAEPESDRAAEFDSLTPITPRRRVRLKIERDDVLTRAAEILAPLAFGQRVLVKAEPRSGRSSLLRGLAKAIAASPDEASLSVLLVDERPEEVTTWREEVPAAELFAASADMHPREQVRVAERALARTKRQAESGKDAVLVIDSLSRLAVAFGDPFEVKRFFGAGRDLAESGAGSLTVIAVALTSGEQGAAVTQAVATTESTTLELSANLAAEGIVPALVASRPSVAGEELLREEDELQAARRLRAELRLMSVEEAARRLAERISATAENRELLTRST